MATVSPRSATRLLLLIGQRGRSNADTSDDRTVDVGQPTLVTRLLAMKGRHTATEKKTASYLRVLRDDRVGNAEKNTQSSRSSPGRARKNPFRGGGGALRNASQRLAPEAAPPPPHCNRVARPQQAVSRPHISAQRRGTAADAPRGRRLLGPRRRLWQGSRTCHGHEGKVCIPWRPSHCTPPVKIPMRTPKHMSHGLRHVRPSSLSPPHSIPT